MDDDEASVKLLLSSENQRKTDLKIKRFQKNRSANALFFGVVLGFVVSFLFAYSGVVDENTSINYSIYDFINKQTNTSDGVPDSTNLAEYLYGEVRVLCVVMTTANALAERGQIIMDTWGKRCNKLLFFSNAPFVNISNVVVVKSTDKFAMLRDALKYVYVNHFNDFDWVLKTNDNSFIVLENLRHMLYQYDTDYPFVIGQRFFAEDYMAGDYALSKRAFSRLLEDAFTSSQLCEATASNDDFAMSKCLEHVNVIKIDGIDKDGRGRFFQGNPESALFPEKFDDYDKWYWHHLKQGIENCCSDRLIAIQNTYNTHLYYMEYFIYKVHAFGRHRNREPLPPKLQLQDIIKNNY